MTAAYPPGEAQGARALRRLFAIQLVSMGAMDMSGPFWPLHLRDLGGLSGGALAWASTLAYAGPLFAAMCLAPAWGRLADRIGHKPMLLRALLALAATQAWIALADSVESVLCARLAQGALAGFIAAAHAYGAQLCDRCDRARMIARLQVATALGSVAGPVAGGALYAAVGFGKINLLAAALCALCALAAWRLLPAVPRCRPEAASPAVPDATALRVTAVPAAVTGIVGLLLGIVAVQAARSMPQAYFGLYAEAVLGMRAWATGLCYGLTAAGLCLGAPLWARRFDGQGNARVLADSALVCAACAVLTLSQTAGVPLAVLLAARFAWGLALGALLPVFHALLSREAPDAAQGRVLGWSGGAAKAGALAGTLLGGLVLTVLPPQWLMWPVAAAYALAAFGLQVLSNRLACQAE